VQSVLTLLLNDLATLVDKLVLILDDYHVITLPGIHHGLTFLLEHQPPQLHIVLSTRADPPLPIARLRAKGQLGELRIRELTFTAGEATTFLTQVMELDLDAQDIQALKKRTEGWIVGLQLAALAIKSPPSAQPKADARAFVEAFTGSHRYILEYLTEEVVHRQPATIQRFLLQTSILERMCGPLCDAVLAEGEAFNAQAIAPRPDTRVDSQAMLHTLQRNNLFVVPLDSEQFWYRYHHLFADLLANLLPDAVQHLFRLYRLEPEHVYWAKGMVPYTEAAW
jgi:LuxR family maltose regulon positive regulatory protein